MMIKFSKANLLAKIWERWGHLIFNQLPKGVFQTAFHQMPRVNDDDESVAEKVKDATIPGAGSTTTGEEFFDGQVGKDRYQ